MNEHISKLLDDCSQIYYGEKPREKFYLNSYPSILDFCSQHRGNFTNGTAMLTVCMAYSWMPRIPENISINDDMLSLLNVVHLSNKLKSDELRILKTGINNSMVGLSKVLHFINPSLYPIWDSNIAKLVVLGKSQKDPIDNYLMYQETLLLLPENVLSKINYLNLDQNQYSKLRKIDMALFSKQPTKK